MYTQHAWRQTITAENSLTARPAERHKVKPVQF